MNSICFSILAASFASAPTASVGSSETSASAVMSARDAQGYDPVLGPVLKVNGTLVPEDWLKRQLAHGLGGKQEDHDKFQVLIQEELDRRKAAGEDIAKYFPTKADVDKKLEKDKQDFLLKYPTLDFATEVGRAFLSVDLYREQAEQAMLFDRIFTPDDPDQWPPLTKEVVIDQGNGPGLIDDAKESYEARKKKMQDEKLAELPPDDPIWTETLRSMVSDALNKFATTEYATERLKPGTLLTVDGHEVSVDGVFNRIKPHVTWDLLADTKKFLAMKVLVEADLKAKGALLTRDEFEKVWDANGPVKDESVADKLQRFQMLALQVQGFPSMEAYIDHERWMESFKKTIADELKDDAKISTLLGPCNAICGAAKVDVEVILASAYDDAHVRWKDKGWAYAEQRAKDIKKELDGGADWNATLDLKSEFWDPPMPEVGQKPQFGFNFKGRFGQQTRNQLIQYLHESDYRSFLDGNSVTDFIFFKQKPGTVDGPTKGARGWYISKVKGTTPPTRPLDLKNPQHRDLLVQYYLKEKFNQYAQGLLAKAIAEKRVEGL